MTRISVIIPVLNEEKYVDDLLGFLVEAYPVEKEIFLVDGGSSDATRSKIQCFQEAHKNIHLLDNPERFVSYALNRAIPLCTGQYIVRLDAHCKYDEDYFKEIIRVFETTGSDIVGGPTRTAYNTPFQQAVGYVISTRFGVGNSSVHQLEYSGETDSVTFGSWKREIFEKTGYFDARMKRNQDDEFHYRAKSLGMRIYQSPSIKLYYYPRSSLISLLSQYFEYGLYKPLVLRKIKSEIKVRHLVPSLFAVYLICLPILVLLSPYFLILLGLYVGALAGFSFINNLPLQSKLACLAAYPAVHLAYGIGFMKGLFLPPKTK